MTDEPASDARSIDPAGFESLERAAGIAGFTLDDDSRHRLEWAIFWARTSQAKREKTDIANLIVELAVQYARAANRSVLASASETPAKATGKGKGDAVTQSFFDFARKALDFVPETGPISDPDLDQHMRKALAAAKRQKDDPNSKLPPERRDELALALAK